VADGNVGAIAFAPDADALAILESSDAGCRVRRFTLPDGPLHTLHACGSAHGLDWSPDGRLLAFTAPTGAGGARALLALPPDGAVATPLTTPPAGAGMDGEPRWSPDGRRLAFARGTPGEQQVYLAAGDGTQARRLGPDDRNRIGGLAWSADGTQLLVAMDATGFPALFAVDPATGGRTLLGARGATAVDAGADAVVYEQRRSDANVWRHELAGETASRRITASALYDAQPAISADGRRIAYVSARDAVGSIWMVDESGAERRLPLDADGIWNRPAWSPDGSRLLLTHYVDGRPTIAEHEPASGRTRTLGPADAAAAAYAGDGSIVYLGRCAQTTCLVHQVGTQAPRVLDATHGVVEFRVGGSRVAWVGEHGTLTVAALDGAAVTQPPAALRTPLDGAWTFAGSVLVMQVEAPGGAALWAFDPATGTQRQLATLPAASAAGPSLAVDAALRVALVARIDGLEADLVRVPAPARRKR
jgi:dipeptidyl aminopeptidase/acylaminoacyl peptidase